MYNAIKCIINHENIELALNYSIKYSFSECPPPKKKKKKNHQTFTINDFQNGKLI